MRGSSLDPLYSHFYINLPPPLNHTTSFFYPKNLRAESTDPQTSPRALESESVLQAI